MNSRQIIVGTLLLLTCGFVAGRAFSQNDFPTNSNVAPQPPVKVAVDAEPDPFDIPMPPQVFRGTLEPTPTASRGVTPMKYFVPVVKGDLSPLARSISWG